MLQKEHERSDAGDMSIGAGPPNQSPAGSRVMKPIAITFVLLHSKLLSSAHQMFFIQLLVRGVLGQRLLRAKHFLCLLVSFDGNGFQPEQRQERGDACCRQS